MNTTNNAAGSADGRAVIAVVGCGGAGCNAIQAMDFGGRARKVAVNTDDKGLVGVSADVKLLIGADLYEGRGAGGVPDAGELAAIRAEEEIAQAVSGCDVVFIVAGMGGGTGSGAAHVVADIASRSGAVTFGHAIAPFSYERSRLAAASKGVKMLEAACDSMIVWDNDRLLNVPGDYSVDESFGIMDMFIEKAIGEMIRLLDNGPLPEGEQEMDLEPYVSEPVAAERPQAAVEVVDAPRAEAVEEEAELVLSQ